MSSAKPFPIAVGRQRSLLVIKPARPCTAVVSTRLKIYLQDLRQPESTDVYFDLSKADHVDSTFVGFIIAISVKPKSPASPRFHLLQHTPDIMQTLKMMRAVQLLDLCDAVPEQVSTWNDLPTEKPGTEDLAEVMLDAHEQLIAADARNAQTFGPVVDAMRRQRGGTTRSS